MEGSEQPGAQTAKAERRVLLERMAERIGAAAGVKTAYGEPVERDGVTVIPVAKVAWGFGGGENAGIPRSARRKGAGEAAEKQSPVADTLAADRSAEGVPEGSGGGGGMSVSPVGYVEIADGRSRFRRIWTPGQVALVVGASGVAVAVAAGAIGRLLGRIRRAF